MRHLLALLSLAPAIAAAAPTTVTQQGRLLDAAGTPITGTVTLSFTLFDAATGGAASWTESHAGVTVDQGFYSVTLGATTALDTAALSGARWLAVSVGGTELSRVPLTAVPWAMRAGVAEGVAFQGQAGGATPTACLSAEVGTLRYNTDRDLLELCRNNAGSPKWYGVALTDAVVTGNDTVGRKFSDGTMATSCSGYKGDARYQGATGDGAYWIQPGVTPVKVWCDMVTEGGGWVDVVKSYHAPSPDTANLSTQLFSAAPGAALTIGPGTSATGDGVFLYSNQSASHSEAIYLTPTVSFTSVRLSYQMQGDEGGTRCNSVNWVPLNGPGFNGGYTTGYQVPCLTGFSCIQGSSEDARDAPIAVNNYAVDGFNPATTLLAWSGSNMDQTSALNCTRDPNIPTAHDGLYVTKLLLR